MAGGLYLAGVNTPFCASSNHVAHTSNMDAFGLGMVYRRGRVRAVLLYNLGDRLELIGFDLQ
jgi:hypothetical protein